MNKQLWGRLKTAAPVVLGLNLFILISPFIPWEPYRQETTQKIYFVFGVIALSLLSLFSKPKRYLTDWCVGAFALWALFLMFWHSQIWVESITYRYLDFFLMSEGFIHVFAAILLYKLVYEYVDKLPSVYFALVFYLGRGFFIKSLTPIFAVAICSLIWCVAKKKWQWFGLMLVLTCAFIGMNTHYIWVKWQARAFAWPYTIKEILQHPFIGTGFDKSIMINLIKGPNGWCFRHNDFLNVTKDLGLPALMLIGVFLFGFIKWFKFRLLDILCLGTLIMGCAQTSWYWPVFAIFAIPLFAIWRVKYDKEVQKV